MKRSLPIDVLIIGGGLAGLTSALHLSKAGLDVLLIEKNTYPQHKVCGEYISNEVIPYLRSLGADPWQLNPAQISRFQLTNTAGKKVEAQLPLGGFGISRFKFDDFLYNRAKDAGCQIVQDTVTDVMFTNDIFEIRTLHESYQAKIVLGAYGKRSAIDHSLQREFIVNKSPWLAVKAHYRGDFPSDLVALHNFPGGYCGVSKVENDLINICYLVNYESFKLKKNISEHQKYILYQNPYLKKILENSEMLFETPLTISQISFQPKEKVNSHILMIGDTAGLIHPLCGNGMSMAIHSAKLSSELVINYLSERIPSREVLEINYINTWNKNFRSRINTGRLLSRVMERENYANTLMSGLVMFPGILPSLIKRTHGKPII